MFTACCAITVAVITPCAARRLKSMSSMGRARRRYLDSFEVERVYPGVPFAKCLIVFDSF